MSQFFVPSEPPRSKPTLPSLGGSVDDGEESVDVFIRDLMRNWEEKYCDYEKLNVFVGTYNVNNRAPAQSLTPWLSGNLDSPPDIYILGFQELDLSQQAWILLETKRELEWTEMVHRGLHEGAKYIELKHIRLVGIFLIVFIRQEHYNRIPQSAIYSHYVATGLLNALGNKGGVSVSIQIDDSRLCFVNSHLASGSDELARRNQDFREISRNLSFLQGYERIGIFDHDVLFWLGDLNYRLESDDRKSLDNQEIRNLLWAGKQKDVLKYDQLLKMRQARSAFYDFSEGEILFQPTYKYDPGTDNWDSSEKCRLCAWCDRVLYMSKSDSVEQKKYESVKEIRISDHKPVRAIFHTTIKKIDAEKQKKIQQEAVREIDRLMNEALPQIELDTLEFNFGRVCFLEALVQPLTIRNTGKYPITIAFEKRPTSNGEWTISEPWLTVTPYRQRVDVGKEAFVDLQVLVDKNSSWQLNKIKRLELSDVLVLKLVRGRHYFISVNGEFIQSAFAQSLEELLRRQSATDEQLLIDLSPTTSDPDVLAAIDLGIPVELYRMVEYVKINCINDCELLNGQPSQNDFIKIRDALDTKQLFPPIEMSFSMIEAIYRFLDSLPIPLIPLTYQDRCFRASQSAIACWQIVQQFPDAHKNAFSYLIDFGRQLVKQPMVDTSMINAFCETFGDLFFQLSFTMSKIRKSGDQEDRKKRSIAFVRNCLDFDENTAINSDLFENRVNVF